MCRANTDLFEIFERSVEQDFQLNFFGWDEITSEFFPFYAENPTENFPIVKGGSEKNGLS